MGGSAKTPKQSKVDKEAQERQLDLQERNTQLAEWQAWQAAQIKPEKILPLAPVATESNADLFEAEEEAKRRLLKRINSGRGTLFAGETGGNRSFGTQTLLG